MSLHRFVIRFTQLLLTWTVITVTFVLGFEMGQKLNWGEPKPRTILPVSSEPTSDIVAREIGVFVLPLEITAIDGLKIFTRVSAGVDPRATSGPEARTLELKRATKIFRVTFDAMGLPIVREVKLSALRVGQQIVVSATTNIATQAVIQPTEIRILE